MALAAVIAYVAGFVFRLSSDLKRFFRDSVCPPRRRRHVAMCVAGKYFVQGRIGAVASVRRAVRGVSSQGHQRAALVRKAELRQRCRRLQHLNVSRDVVSLEGKGLRRARRDGNRPICEQVGRSLGPRRRRPKRPRKILTPAVGRQYWFACQPGVANRCIGMSGPIGASGVSDPVGLHASGRQPLVCL
jgi:hypothetical protein